LSTPSTGESYDWTFSYKLSRPVYCEQSNGDSTVIFETDSNNNLTGFKIKVKNKTDSEAAEINKIKTEKLVRILTILSGVELHVLASNTQGIPYKPGLLRVSKDFIIKYNIDGSIDKVDMTDSNIGNIINKSVNPELNYLSDAVVHKSHGRYSEAIKSAFRVIDESNAITEPDYDKYKCLRDILSHREGQQLYPNTKRNFLDFYKPLSNNFDFMHCDENNGVFIFDLDSAKTKKTLELVAEKLIGEARRVLKL
jgi:hypothetical protein